MKNNTRITDRAALKEKFDAHVAPTETDCRVWVGPKQIRIGDVFLTPRRAAWFLKHGKLPAGEIKVKCVTENCVAWKHLEEGAARNAGPRTGSARLNEKQIAEIKANREGLSIPAQAEKFGVSVGTIHRYRK